MVTWLLLGAAISSLIAVAVCVRWWLKAWAIANVLGRITPALIEADEFFTLLDLSGHDSHFLERHGPMLKTCEVLQRAMTGRLDVSGHAGKPTASARWFRHADILRAVTSAAEHWASNGRPKVGRFVFAFQDDIGEGYPKGGGDLIKTRLAIVVICKGIAITAYPLLDSRGLDSTVALSTSPPA
jgi:hypothetical protein